MILTKKQQEQFINRYKSLYGDTSKETWTGEIPKVHESKQKEHIKLWKDFLSRMLWAKTCKKIYVHRGGRKEDYLHLVFNNLYMNYWPTYIDDEGNVSQEHLWIDDVD